MSDDLTTFRDHCARMAKAEHVPECLIDCCLDWRGIRPFQIPSPHCTGCVTDADRALWQRPAQEVDDYLAPTTEEGLFA